MLDLELADVFSADGPLARAQPGYTPRAAQQEMAQAIAQAIATRATLVAEAGTGTGKTWAYLVPALLAGGKVLISTGTRPLQDQLYARDLPRVRDALSLPINAALLKGRSNYVCHYHLTKLRDDDRGLRSRAEVAQLRRIELFVQHTKTGDKADLADIPEDADIWHRATSTRENCLGQECPNVRDCFLLKARRRAQEADVVIVNHALFMADLALREEGVTDLLPRADIVIFDEAHQLPDTATRFLGESVSSNQILDLCRMIEVAGLAHARESGWSEVCGNLEQAVREWRLTCVPMERLPGRKATFEAVPDHEAFDAALADVCAQLDTLSRMLKAVSERHPDLDAAAKSCAALNARIERWRTPGRDGTPPMQADQVPAVRWVEHGMTYTRLHSAPLSVAESFAPCRQPEQAWILTSATLSVRGDFSHFTTKLGLAQAEVRRWESPFDYATQALLYVPKDLPEPKAPDYQERFVALLQPLIEANPGGTLVLCTTLRAVDRIAQLLVLAAEDKGWTWPILRQGEQPRGQLLDRFQSQAKAVLVGSASFWEGIDLPGESLTLVAIDKLPFAPPDDPVLEARLRVCREQGGNPFNEYQVPEAALALKQGAGRLIRTEQDWGVLMIGDVRLVEKKSYGPRLWQGLPPFARTRELDQALAFYAAREAQRV